MNSIHVIHPYKYMMCWMFDDEKVGLIEEPFVSGFDEIIDKLAEQIPNAEKGFIFLFSSEKFPGCSVDFEWRREENGGNWYYCGKLGMEGWLCPALENYFKIAPKKFYAQFKGKQ